MNEFLELTVDKFTFRFATDRLYHPEGVWARPSVFPTSPSSQAAMSPLPKGSPWGLRWPSATRSRPLRR